MSETLTPRARHPWLGGADLLVGALLLSGVWVALPARWWPVDVVGTLLGAAFVVTGVGLLIKTP